MLQNRNSMLPRNGKKDSLSGIMGTDMENMS